MDLSQETAAADDDTAAPAAADSQRIINTPPSDKQKTRDLIEALRSSTIDDPDKVISMLESTPEMLEFIGENLVLVHSYYSRFSQFLTNDEKICDKSRKVVNFLRNYYTNNRISKEVKLTPELSKKCSRYMSPIKLMSDDVQPEKVPTSVDDILGGSKSRRRHRRHRKHARKTRHKRKYRSRIARKHKKYTRRR